MNEYVLHVTVYIHFKLQQNYSVVTDYNRQYSSGGRVANGSIWGPVLSVSEFGGQLCGPVGEHLSCALMIHALSTCELYFKKMREYKTSTCLTATLLFPQFDEQCELKDIEREKAVVALPPKEASKCHREDLAKAFYVRIESAFDASCGKVF